MSAETIEALHPDPAKHSTRVNRRKYAAYRDALLEVIPATDDGVQFSELPDAVAPQRLRKTV